MPEFFEFAYDRRVIRELLFLRSTLNWKRSDVDCMIAAIVLGALHGESDRSPSYLSNQMPHAIATKPDYSVRYWRKHALTAPERDTFALIREKLAFRYESEAPDLKASVFLGDMRRLPSLIGEDAGRIRCVVTSPPYLDITNFEEDQWLRNWFLGGPVRPTTNRLTRDNRHVSADAYWGLIADMWRVLGYVLAPRADVVIRFGAKKMSPTQMVRILSASAMFSGRKIRLASHEVSEIRNRQTDTFRPGSKGCLVEVDCHFAVA